MTFVISNKRVLVSCRIYLYFGFRSMLLILSQVLFCFCGRMQFGIITVHDDMIHLGIQHNQAYETTGY